MLIQDTIVNINNVDYIYKRCRTSEEVRSIKFYIIKIVFNSIKDPLEFAYKTEKERDDVFEKIYKCIDHLEWR